MARRRPLRVYEVYDTMFGLSSRTIDYIRFKGSVIRVAARSVKQAYLLAARQIWSHGPGTPGILEIIDEHPWPDGVWVCWDGRTGPGVSGRYRHGQSWEKPKGGTHEG